MRDHQMSNKSMHRSPGGHATGAVPAAVVAVAEWAVLLGMAYDTYHSFSRKNFIAIAEAAYNEIGVATERKLWNTLVKRWPQFGEALDSYASTAMFKKGSGDYVEILKKLPSDAKRDWAIYSDFKDYLKTDWGSVLFNVKYGTHDENITHYVEDDEREALGEGILALEAKSKESLRKMDLAPIPRPTKLTTKAESSSPSSSTSPTFGPTASASSAVTTSSKSTASSASPEVETAQKILTALGFDTKGVDGKIGNNTRSAILAFQKKNGLPATGSLDPATMKKLRSMAPSSLAASLGGKSGGMSTGMKIGLAVAGVAAVGGLAYYFLSDDEDEVVG